MMPAGVVSSLGTSRYAPNASTSSSAAASAARWRFAGRRDPRTAAQIEVDGASNHIHGTGE